MRRSLFFIFFGIALCFCAMTSAAQAQATRTWVSGTGDDANPCSRTAPCKTFPGAYSRTAVGGEIDVLDPGGFGTISIGHALTIDGGGGVVASILASSTSGVNVNAAAGDKVILRNIMINGISQSSFPGTSGIIFNSGGTLIVDHCYIQNFGTNGITFQPTNASALVVLNTQLENFGNDGIIISTAAAAGGVNRATVRNSNIVAAAHNGVEIGVNSRVELFTITSSNNGLDGVLSNGSNINVGVDEAELSNNGFNGVHSQGGSTIRVSNSSMYDNANLGVSTDTGSIFSGLNNRVKGNQGGDGSFTGPIPLT
jgi:hypothetical protein